MALSFPRTSVQYEDSGGHPLVIWLLVPNLQVFRGAAGVNPALSSHHSHSPTCRVHEDVIPWRVLFVMVKHVAFKYIPCTNLY